MFALLLALAQDPLLAKASERLAAEPRCVIDPASSPARWAAISGHAAASMSSMRNSRSSR